MGQLLKLRTLAWAAVALPIVGWGGFVTDTLAAEAGAITIVLADEPPSLEPCESKHSSVGRVVINNITESLTRLSPETGEVVPSLATSWEQVSDLVWRFKIRSGVTFSDGTPLNAEAVAASFDRLQNKEMNCTTKLTSFGGIDIESKAIDEDTVEFTTNKRIPIFPIQLSAAQITAPSMAIGTASRTPVGTGPYKLDEWVPGERIVLSLRDGYWGQEPDVKKATFLWRSESALRAAMVAQGEADLAPIISSENADNPKTDFSYKNGEITRMRIATNVAPLDDKRVRLALNLAIDREALHVLFGEGAQQATQLVGPTINGYNPDIKPYPYDPARAKELLAEAKAEGVAVETPITVLARTAFYMNSDEILEAMQAMWAEVGFNVTIRTLETGNWQRFQNRPFPEPDLPSMLQDSHDNLQGDASFTAFAKYHSKGQNSATYSPEVDQLIEKGEIASGEERTTSFQKMFQILHDDVIPDVSMFEMVGYTRVGPRLDWKPSISLNSETTIADMKLSGL